MEGDSMRAHLTRAGQITQKEKNMGLGKLNISTKLWVFIGAVIALIATVAEPEVRLKMRLALLPLTVTRSCSPRAWG